MRIDWITVATSAASTMLILWLARRRIAATVEREIRLAAVQAAQAAIDQATEAANPFSN